jgi:hypothetical protein
MQFLHLEAGGGTGPIVLSQRCAASSLLCSRYEGMALGHQFVDVADPGDDIAG